MPNASSQLPFYTAALGPTPAPAPAPTPTLTLTLALTGCLNSLLKDELYYSYS